MFVNRVTIYREGWAANPEKPFHATIEVHGDNSKIELKLAPEMSARIVAIVAEEVAAAGRATAEAMTAEVFTVAALPAPSATETDIPF